MDLIRPWIRRNERGDIDFMNGHVGVMGHQAERTGRIVRLGGFHALDRPVGGFGLAETPLFEAIE